MRSILTGDPDKSTVRMTAPRPLTTGDVMFAVGKLGRAAGFETLVGKICIGRDPTVAVFDMTPKAAKELVEFSGAQALESIEFALCDELPELQSVNDQVSRVLLSVVLRGPNLAYLTRRADCVGSYYPEIACSIHGIARDPHSSAPTFYCGTVLCAAGATPAMALRDRW